MDPNQAWRDLITTVTTVTDGVVGDMVEARYIAADLNHWLVGGGFPPRITGQEIFDRLCAFAVCEKILDWSVRLDGPVEGPDQRQAMSTIRTRLKKIVVTAGQDEGVVLLDSPGTTHYDNETKCEIYDNEFFSPLGDALIEIYKLIEKALI